MTCQCGSERIASVDCKCSDMFGCYIGEKEYYGYVPRDMGLGGGDYLRFDFCLDCGRMQGTFPLPPTQVETQESD
jgi:hypothetical protein